MKAGSCLDRASTVSNVRERCCWKPGPWRELVFGGNTSREARGRDDDESVSGILMGDTRPDRQGTSKWYSQMGGRDPTEDRPSRPR